MTKLFDEIHEELKREDLLRKVWRILPFVLLVSILTLLGVGIVTWNDYQTEKALYQTERQYNAAVKKVQNKAFQEAKTQFEPLVSRKDGMGFLASLYKMALLQEQFQETASEAAWEALYTTYTQNCTLYAADGGITNLLWASLAFAGLDSQKKDAKIQQKLKEFEAPNQTWNAVGAMYGALEAYLDNAPKRIQSTFHRWEKSVSPRAHVYWLPLYCSIGAGVHRSLEVDTEVTP